MSSTNPRLGLAQGLTAYTIWGLFPLYFKTLDYLPALEIISQRILWSALFGLLLLYIWKHPGWFRNLTRQPKWFLVLFISSALITGNWLIYVWAVNNDHMVEASLGYYINPLVNVLLGMLVLREKLRRLQKIAVALAVLGVIQQIWMLGKVPWISLALAFSFGIYGLLRKQAPVSALPGLVVETWLMMPLALGWLLLSSSLLTWDWSFWLTSESLWVMLAGPVTLIPLLCFNAAARNLPYSTLGFLQYIAPTLVLIMAVFYFNEPFDSSRLIAFILIWCGLGVYTLDALLLIRRRYPDPETKN